MTEKNKIVLTAETELIDESARELIERIWVKLVTLNERTKQHTKDIQELRRKLK